MAIDRNNDGTLWVFYCAYWLRMLRKVMGLIAKMVFEINKDEDTTVYVELESCAIEAPARVNPEVKVKHRLAPLIGPSAREDCPSFTLSAREPQKWFKYLKSFNTGYRFSRGVTDIVKFEAKGYFREHHESRLAETILERISHSG